MPGGFPFTPSISSLAAAGALTASTAGTTVTVGGADNTKGAWTQLTSSTSSQCDFMLVIIYSNSTVPWAYACDIGIGASGSEVVIAPNLVQTYQIAQASIYWVPTQIPTGSRIAARAQCDASTGSVSVIVMYGTGNYSLLGAANIDAIGFSASTTKGTVVTASSSANTKGSYAQLTSSTSRSYRGLMVGLDESQAYNIGNYLIDVAVGAAGSEQVLLSNLFFSINSNKEVSGTRSVFWVQIPSGTRVAARCQCDTGSNYIGLTLYGIP